MSKTYTLQSVITGLYITALFEDQHKDIFASNDIEQAYKWNEYLAVYHLSLVIGSCEVITITEGAELPMMLREQAY